MGAIGSGISILLKGTGILLAVSIIYGYFETFKKEKESGNLDLFWINRYFSKNIILL